MRQQTELSALAPDEVTARATGDTQAAAFRWLADRHLDSSYRLARAIMRNSAEAEDATHDAFIQAWRHWGELRDSARFEQWFTRILVNTCRTRLRRASRFDVHDVSAELVPTVDALDQSDVRETVRSALAQLSPDHRIVVALRFYRDMTVDDIAAQLGIPAGTVHSRLHYALKRLQTVLDSKAREL